MNAPISRSALNDRAGLDSGNPPAEKERAPVSKARRKRLRFRPRLSIVLMIVNIAVIAVPLGSIFFFRIYENQLIQETEREMISQAALIAAVYRATVPASLGRLPETAARQKSGEPLWTPVNPRLDLAVVETLPARPDGLPAVKPPSALTKAAGDVLSPILETAQMTTLIGVRVLDADGTVVGGTAEIGLNFAHVEEVGTALKGVYQSALRAREVKSAPRELITISRGTGVRVFVAFPILSAGRVLGVVYLSRTPKSVLRHLYEERTKAVLALVTVLIFAISLAFLTSRTISRPVGQLLERTRRVTTGESATMAPLDHPGTSEMSELSEGISQMARTLSDRAAYIRTLANHVSHEFKTPLTSIEGAVELLQDHHDTMSEDERARFLENIAGSSTRLRALLDRLLELARAENANPTSQKTVLLPVIQSVASTQPQGVEIVIHAPPGLRALVAEEALRIVLGNLFENAVQHGASRVSVTVERGRRIQMRVRDNGIGITPANRTRVFEHFFTTRRETGGTGLGLGIVQALLTAHGGNIRLNEKVLEGTEFIIELRT
ncbi:MAG: HAMP domain-containing sensor histidine kinase [Pseudomonadota bacterium]